MADEKLQTIAPPAEIAGVGTGFDRYIELALNKSVAVDILERLLTMQREVMAINAKSAYDEAMRAFQAACPIIQKHKKVMNKDGVSVRYVYAPLDDIIEQVKGPLADHGFSYRLGQEIDKPKQGWLTVYCTATHALGHAETEKFELPLGTAQYMTAQQEVGAARTFGSRYCFLGVFGIMTGDEDTDANPPCVPATQSAPPAGKTPTPAKPASPPSPGGVMTATGFVANMETNPKPTKTGGYRTKITLADRQTYYTFDKKIVDIVSQHSLSGPATITYVVGKFGNDIKTLTFEAMATEPIAEYNGELGNTLHDGGQNEPPV